MKFTVNTYEFKTALEKAIKVTGTQTIKTVENVLIRKVGNKVHLISTNFEQFVDMKIEGFGDDAEFIFSDTKAISKAMKFFTEYQIEFDCGEYEVIISCGGKKAKQRILDAEFPEFPIVDGKIYNKFEYSNKKLKERFNAVKYAVLTDDSKPVFQGIYFDDSSMVTCDTLRIALNKDTELCIANSFVVLPNVIKNVNEIMSENINIETNEKYVQITDDNTVFIARLIDGEFINYSRFINNDFEKSIVVDVKELTGGLRYLRSFMTIAEVKQKGVCWYQNKLGIINMSGYYENAINTDGEMNVEIAFNPDFMNEALTQFKDQVKISYSTRIAPMLITSDNDKNNIALVLPTNPKEYVFNTNKQAG